MGNNALTFLLIFNIYPLIANKMDYKSTSLLKYNCLLVLINFHGLIISSLGQEISPINTTGYLSLTNSADSNINLMNTTTAVTPTVPPMPDDLFKFLHNYSSPNAAVCFKMFLDYYKVWSLTFSDRYCFCNGFPTCDPTRYNITKDHQKYLDWFLDVQWERNKRTRVKLAAEDAFRDFIEFKSILIALYSLVWIWGISGNAIVILTILRFMNKSNVTNIFILNLSVSDMVVTAFCLPFRAMVKVGRIWYFGNWMCKGVIWVFYGSFMVSSFTMTAMAMERYLVICHPMKAQYISTPGRAKKIITVVWIASIGLSALPAYFVTGETDTYSCQLRLHPALDEGGKHEYVTSSVLLQYYTFSVAFILPLLVMIFAYTRTGITLYRSVKEARALTGNTSSTKQSQDKDKKEDDLKTRIQVVRMLVVVLAVFVIAWLPHTLMEIIRYHHKFVPTSVKEQRDAALWVWWNNLENNINSGFILLTFVNSCLNPVFYAFLSRSFKKGFAKLFACCPCCKNAAKRRQLEASTSISSGLTASTSGLSTSG